MGVGWIATAEGQLDFAHVLDEAEVDRQPEAGQKGRDPAAARGNRCSPTNSGTLPVTRRIRFRRIHLWVAGMILVWRRAVLSAPGSFRYAHASLRGDGLTNADVCSLKRISRCSVCREPFERWPPITGRAAA